LGVGIFVEIHQPGDFPALPGVFILDDLQLAVGVDFPGGLAVVAVDDAENVEIGLGSLLIGQFLPLRSMISYGSVSDSA
jgi:hypothetical protein